LNKNTVNEKSIENKFKDLNIANKDLSIIILAAGKGKRMKSDLPKVLHKICFRPIIYYVLSNAYKLNPKNVFTVVGFGRDVLQQYIEENFKDCISVLQEEQLGTAHAVLSVEKHKKVLGKEVLIIAGDMPLLSYETLLKTLKFKHENNLNAVLVTAIAENPYGYGRIIKNNEGSVLKIVEETDASPKEKAIKEVNSSIYCFDTDILFNYLKRISAQNAQSEFYLTDIIELISAEKKYSIKSYIIDNFYEVEGVNDRLQLSKLEKKLQRKINEKLMLSGVTIRDPDTVYIDIEAEIGKDTIIEPFCFISGKTKIGNNCVIGPFTQINESIIGNKTNINKSFIQGSTIGNFNNIGPTSYIRPGTVTGDNVKIGACCEIKKSIISSNSKVPHLSYIGDAEVGSNVNVGAATVTCNYDGFFKNKTIIEDNVFIGSDTMLVAPVKIGKNAITAAGSVISEDVPQDSLAIERTKQVNIVQGAIKFREKKKNQKDNLNK